MLALAAVLFQCEASAQSERVGQLTDVRGKVEVLRGTPESPKLQRAFTGFQLRDGDVVIARLGSHVISILYGNGARYKVVADAQGDSKAQVRAHEPATSRLEWWKTGRKPTLLGRFAAVPQISRLLAGSAGVRAMGRGIDTRAVPGEDLQLLWKPFKEAGQVSIQVRVNGKAPQSWQGDSSKLLAGSACSYSLPGGDVPAGAAIQVAVFGLRPGATPPEQSWRVTVLSTEEAAGLLALRTEADAEGRAGSAEASARVLLARAYARCNRLEEALKVCRDCRKSMPEDGGILCTMQAVLAELVSDHPESQEYAQELSRIQALHTKSQSSGHVCDDADEKAG